MMKRRELATMLAVAVMALMTTTGCRRSHRNTAEDKTRELAAALGVPAPPPTSQMNIAAPLPPTAAAAAPAPAPSLTGLYTCFFCPGTAGASKIAIVTQSGNFVQITRGKTVTSCVSIQGQLACDVKGAQPKKMWRANLVPNARGELRGEYISPTGAHPFVLLPKRA